MILVRDTVDCWNLSLDTGDVRQLEHLETLLEETERVRARRFHFERDRCHFTRTRACLRVLLGRYLDMPSMELTFGYTERGKPFLKGPSADIRFNVSHSGGEALFAIVRGREVGVDLEAGERLGDDWPAIARRYFSAREQVQLNALSPREGRTAFLNGWARKEAYLKATGLGIADGLQNIEVTLAPGEPPAFLSPEIAARWTFCDLGTRPASHAKFASALVVERLSSTEPPPAVRHFSMVSVAALLAHDHR